MERTFFRTVTRDFLEANVNDFISLCQRNMKEEYWDQSHFLADLPGKWNYSFYATDDVAIKGFIIASEKEQSIHIHKFVIDKPYQREGLGSAMLEFIIDLATKPLTLKVRTDNDQAISFYKKKNFVVTQNDSGMFSMIRPQLS